MASQWYYTKSGDQLGPVSSTQLRQLAASGEIGRTDHVFKVGAKDWITAMSVKDLFPTTPATVPTPVPPPAPSLPASSVFVTAELASGVEQSNPISMRPLHERRGTERRARYSHAAQKPISIWDFFDVRFQRYLTPVIIRIAWGLCLVLAFLGVTLAGVLLLSPKLPQSASSMARYLPRHTEFHSSGIERERTSDSFGYRLFVWLSFVVASAIFLWTARIIFESIIVLFNIAKSLTSIEQATHGSI